jgi:predicted nucleotidyltransferase
MLGLRSHLRQKLLRYYFTNPASTHYVRELARILEVDATNLSKELSRLAAEGLFVSEPRGKHTYFRLNRQYRLYNEIRGIVSKTFGVTDTLAKSLKQLSGIEKAYLYGSFAQDRQDATSDVDVLVVGNPVPLDLAAAVQRLESTLGRDVNYVVMSAGEFNRRMRKHDPFLADIWRNPKIELVHT